MSRNICFVIDELIAELSSVVDDSSCKLDLSEKLERLKSKAENTALEAMYLRWGELDRLIDDLRERDSFFKTGFAKAYLHTWE